jgi:hypothetical protein
MTIFSYAFFHITLECSHGMTEAQGVMGAPEGTSRTTLNAALDDFWNCALAFGAAFNLVDAAFTSLR